MDDSDCFVDLNTNLGSFRARFQPKSHDTGPTLTADPGIVKCLGIQYADIPHRWAAP